MRGAAYLSKVCLCKRGVFFIYCIVNSFSVTRLVAPTDRQMKNAIVADIGGTSTDVGQIVNGFPRKAAAKVEARSQVYVQTEAEQKRRL